MFSKFNFHIPEDCVRKIVCSTPGSIEPVLCTLRERMEAGPKEIAQEERQVRAHGKGAGPHEKIQGEKTDGHSIGAAHARKALCSNGSRH